MQVFLFALGTALATGLGALPFALVRVISSRMVAYANAIASGLMLGASFGLVEQGTHRGGWETFLGANLGVAFILGAQRLLGHREIDFGGLGGKGASPMLLMVLVMTVHSFSEGVAVGGSFGGGAKLATAITLAIGVHNIPEGLAITAVLRPRGKGILACAWWSVFSSLPQPVMAVPAYLFVEHFERALPYGLGFAGGAMIFMVISELLPEAYEQSRGMTVSLLSSLTFIVMMLFQRSI